ncbi:MAG: hypothetical protein IT424_04930 [Pirellulales bacterium]|nr:hypothetical protein [Pirellulales bacterium]
MRPKSKCFARHAGDRARRLSLEALEDRRLLAITVNTLIDELDGSVSDGDASLRDALLAHAPFETIDFDPALFSTGPAQILLSRGELRISKDVTIQGPGSAILTINGAGNDLSPFSPAGDGSRLFHINNGSAGSMIDVHITGLNLVSGDASGDGGAIRSSESLTLNDVAIAVSSSRGNGGAIYSAGVLTLINSRLTDNIALNNGGAIYSIGGALTIHHSTMAFNNAARGGAVFVTAAAGDANSWIITDSTIFSNYAFSDGGALAIEQGSGRLQNSTVSGNFANGFGGGIWIGPDPAQTVVIANATITANTADGDFNGVGAGGGMAAGIGPSVRLLNTLVASNAVWSNTAPDILGLATASYSLIGNNAGASLTDFGGNQIGTPASPIDPRLGPLVENGGTTLTHMPLSNSPILNAGDPASAPGGVMTPFYDQRGDGFSRVQMGRIDIGAFEARPVSIRGRKWNDLDQDGQEDPAEPGLPGWVIYLDVNRNSIFDINEASAVTDANGEFSFSELPPGDYRIGEAPQPGWMQTYPTSDVLGQLNANYATVTSQVPNLYFFSEGEFGNSIDDGGGDMYDTGNVLNTNLASAISYTGGAMAPGDAMFGPGSRYFTAKYPGLFALAAFNASIDSFFITGNNGADGSGFADAAELHTSVNGQAYTVYVKRVFNAGDPSINEIIMVPGDGVGLTHSITTNTNDGYHELSGLSSVDEFYYALVSTFDGSRIDDAVVLNVANQFLASAEAIGGFHSISLAEDAAGVVDFGNVALPGSISGQKWEDRNDNGRKDPAEPGLPGWTVYLDLNEDGALQPSTTTTSAVEPDDFAPSTDLTSAVAGVTLSAADFLGTPTGESVVTADVGATFSSTGVLAFGGSSFNPTWDASHRLRADFPEGANGVSIDVISDDASDIGLLQAFDSSGALLASVTSPSLTSGNHYTLSVASSTGGIAYVLAGGAGGDVVFLDHLSFERGVAGEPFAVTDGDGNYSIPGVAIGTYVVREASQPGWTQTFPRGQIALFDDGAFVDTFGGSASESDNEQATLASFGAVVAPFVGTDGASWSTALATASLVVIPELELNSLAAFLSPEAASALRDYIAAGGGLIVHGSYSAPGWAAQLLNEIFGFSLVESQSSSTFTLTGGAAGTAFEGNAPTLPSNDGTNSLAIGTLPAGTNRIYANRSQTAVALLPYGAGQIAYLGWDWYDAAPVGSQNSGWLDTLRSATQQVALPTAPAGSYRVTVGPGQDVEGIDFGNLAAPTLRGEFNNDGIVDGGDLLKWQMSFGDAVASATEADGDGNGVVDSSDLGVWMTHFGEAASPAPIDSPTSGGAAISASAVDAVFAAGDFTALFTEAQTTRSFRPARRGVLSLAANT